MPTLTAAENVMLSRELDGLRAKLVTHEPQHAAWADRIVFLRDGAVVDVATGGSSIGGDPTSPLFAAVGLDEEPSR